MKQWYMVKLSINPTTRRKFTVLAESSCLAMIEAQDRTGFFACGAELLCSKS